ncbi:MAG: hypothetical protein A3G49_05740 [Candidatus Sungbacteria bacterium RIFCSPLOWO2_12_FULL_41_11]|uniref:HD/PDEase domain-containing protein n=1 Tax=Candidatus Sungbacteria bacterium RIFCSPLOWO2_12_FULL_41_11 TaxID=1802286 RepID=A0A1G2LSY1_9BACT|nr:MAG: (P)ppGpp synthetase I, SpoT/RelA [Parcubacteria group bacterium GW2011_GWA2_42_14]OHA14653.1 MAG: hypothetical protein A3G49_05740 [Candidatus Sungbacteria bacterium RIFCSPLOWO2_12_FULL_41_11]
MNRKEFFDKINGFVSVEDNKKISQAYWLAKEVHREQKRDGGERYFEHCRRVALFLIEHGSTNADEIITALLHDCVEDGFVPDDLLEKLFGATVSGAVETLSKITRIFDEATGAVKEKKKKNLDDYFRKIFESAVFIRRVKLADRLDNLRSMDIWPEKRKQKYLLETEKYILPIALATDMRFYNELLVE